MAADDYLSPAELRSLTNAAWRNKQIAALNRMGVTHRVRPDGSIAVLRAHRDELFKGGASPRVPKGKTSGPNWSALDASQAKP